ncbi:MAG: hypothetical protein K2M17_02835 [Bacilli bacterium]|nr:hypothetical protein [Bacilli bacterium]
MNKKIIEININEINENRHKVINKIKTFEITVIVCECILCSTEHKIVIPTQNLCSWLSGEKLIQHALITIPNYERELLLSQICGKCWEEFKPDDE